MANKIIGIVGGVGNYAGIELIKKIYDLTDATCDQDHLSISMLSYPQKIVDRTEYLFNDIDINPGFAIAEIISLLISTGAEVVGIPCNTAHSSPIFNVIRNNVQSSCKIINLIDEVAVYLCKKHSEVKNIGLLCTNGTLRAKVYHKLLNNFDYNIIQPSDEIQNKIVHPSIYDKEYGIKAIANPVTQKAKKNIMSAINFLDEKGAQVIILGCTEISLAITENKIGNTIIINPISILAKALIRESNCNV